MGFGIWDLGFGMGFGIWDMGWDLGYGIWDGMGFGVGWDGMGWDLMGWDMGGKYILECMSPQMY